MIAIIIDTSKWVKQEFDNLKVIEYYPNRYEADTLEECLDRYVYDCNEAHDELYAESFRVNHILVYHNEFENEMPYILTDMTPFEKYLKQIKCYDWSLLQ